MKKGLCKVFLIILATLFAFAVGSCSVEQEPVPQSYTLQYVAGSGGTIQGKETQIVEKGKDGETVTAVSDEGYSFVKWSDGVTSAERQDLEINSNITVTASFSSNYKTFKLDCGYGYLENNQTEITLNRKNFEQIDFPVPIREGFAFNGWYIGGTKVTDENGKMLIGESILNKSSTVIAKWTLVETFTYKILLVYVTEIQATLPTRDNSAPINVNYTMSDIEREFCKATTKQLKRCMDDMLDGLVEFEIDEYFTTQTILTENFAGTLSTSTAISNSLFPTNIPEVSAMLDDYDSVLSVLNLEDFDNLLHYSAGAASAKYGEVYFDSFIYGNGVYNVSFNDMIKDLEHSRWTDWMEVFIHETAHTIEYRILGNYLNTEYSYHNTGASYNLWVECKYDVILANKLYYLQAIEKNGIKVGIPYGFWKGDIATVKYLVSNDTYGSQGYTKSDNIGTANPVGSGNMWYEVVYENNITVTAVPITGYQFVGWSDGVTTATRTDFITGDFEVTAIFEKLN